MNTITTKTKISLLAHDNLQTKLSEFIFQHEEIFKRFELIIPKSKQKLLQLLKKLPLATNLAKA